MEFSAIFLILFVTSVIAGDTWDDFYNSFATDLTPLLALFGEQVTKQFLSESTSILDNIIFAAAPLGILTAVVSVFRLYGSPSQRAFVGRAQESRTLAEAELCSSTSDDVCEVWHHGGFARVYGKPKLLEIVFDRDTPFWPANLNTRPTAHIFPLKEYYVREEDHLGNKVDINNIGDNSDDCFAPSPNLSLNIGIKRPSTLWLVFVALFGIMLQVGVLGFGIWVTYVKRIGKEGRPIPSWALPLTLIGTTLLAFGMFLCAMLVERTTKEHVLHRSPGNKFRMLWLQEGGQKIADQIFESFAFSAQLNTYTVSKKTPIENTSLLKRGLLASLAVSCTCVGFVLQFIGLRGLHSFVALSQLGATVLMAIIRAGLRSQRSGLEKNELRDRHMNVSNHELDWFTHRIELEEKFQQFDTIVEQPEQDLESKNNQLKGLVNGSLASKLVASLSSNDWRSRMLPRIFRAVKNISIDFLTALGPKQRSRLCEQYRKFQLDAFNQVETISGKSHREFLTEFIGKLEKGEDIEPGELDALIRRVQLCKQLDFADQDEIQYLYRSNSFHWDIQPYNFDPSLQRNELIKTIGRQLSPAAEGVLQEKLSDIWQSDELQSGESLESAAKLMHYRARLSRLAHGQSSSIPYGWAGVIRGYAEKLAKAIDAAGNYLFNKHGLNLVEDWSVSTASKLNNSVVDIDITVYKLARNQGLRVDLSEIEAVLGLWTWSIQKESNISGSDRFNKFLGFAESKYELGRVETNFSILGSSARKHFLNKILPKPGIERPPGLSIPLAILEANKTLGEKYFREAGKGKLQAEECFSLFVEVTHELPLMCAQDLFVSFLSFATIDVWPLGPDPDLPIEMSRGGYPQFFDEALRPIAEAFVSAELGTFDDALLSIVPTLEQTGFFEIADDTMEALIETAIFKRRESRYLAAQPIFEWAYYHVGQNAREMRERIFAELAEVYRQALLDKDLQMRDFGYKGILGLQDIAQGEVVLEKICDTYVWAGLQISRVGEGCPWTRHLEKRCRVVESVAEDLASALRSDPFFPTYLVIVGKWFGELGAFRFDGKKCVLCVAAERGCYTLAEEILSFEIHWRGAFADALRFDHRNCPAAAFAAAKGYFRILKLLMGDSRFHLWDSNSDHGSRTLLGIAAENGHPEIVEYLLECGKKINAIDGEGHQTALSRAVANGHSKVVELLVQRGAKFKLGFDENEATPLWIAVSRLDDAMVRVLLEAGAHVNEEDSRGVTPFQEVLRRFSQIQDLGSSKGRAEGWKCIDSLVALVDYEPTIGKGTWDGSFRLTKGQEAFLIRYKAFDLDKLPSAVRADQTQGDSGSS